MLPMTDSKKTTGKKTLPPENLIDETLKMDRLLYLRIIQEKESLTSLQMTREVLALRNNLKPEQIGDRNITKHNPNINKRLKDLTDLGILNDHEGRYTLSPIGYLIIDELIRLKLNIEVLREHKDFFDIHDYTVIPSQQFREIHKLRFAKQCKDAIDYKREIENNTAKTEHEIHIVTERLHDMPSWIIEELKQGTLALKLVYQFEEPFKINFDDEEERILCKEIMQKALPGVELRYLTLEDRNPIGIRIIDEKWGILHLFERRVRKLNRVVSFYGENEQFISWIEDIFSSIWKISKPLKDGKALTESS